jgi:hypothetical protein
MSMSNVIDLDERRKQKENRRGTDAPRARNLIAGTGFTLLVPAAALVCFVAYQSIRLQILGDTFVIALLLALGAYVSVGAALVRFGRRLNAAPAPVTRDEAEHLELNAEEGAPDIIEFPRLNPAARGLISIRCPRCAERYLARPGDLTCSSCGRTALAG